MARKVQEVSIYKIAAEAGVSVPTVSRVINRKAGIAEATRNKVNTLLERYNFRPEYPAMRAVKIAVVYPWTDLSDYFRKAMKGVYDYTRQNDLTVNIVTAQPPRRESLLQMIRDQQCSGVIALLTEQYEKELAPLDDTDLPVMVIDSSGSGRKAGFIDNDSYSGSAAAAGHLIELGHRKIGYLTYEKPALNQFQRLKGALNTFEANHIAIDAAAVIRLSLAESSPVRGENGFNAMRQLLRQYPAVTAVMAGDDSMALGAMAAIHEAGLRIPEDISVIGFDNYAETAYWYPALTTVDHPLEKAGYMAAEAIHAGLRTPGEWEPLREILPTNLVIRKSTGEARVSS